MLVSDSPPLRIIGADFDFYGEIDAYLSLTITRKYSQPGTFEAIIPLDGAEKILAPGRYALIDDFCGLIERIKFSAGSNDAGETITVSGCEADGILRYRLCLPRDGEAYDTVTGTPGACMAALVEHAAISPTDTARALPLTLGDIDASGESITVKARYDVLSDLLTEIGDAAGLGWRIRADLDTLGWKFEVYSGRDLSVNQPANSVNPPMIFSPQFDNLSASSYEWAITDTYNCAIVAGQGEGAERATATVYTESGLSGSNLREMFVDARDIEVAANLQTRGQNKLRENAEVRSFDGSAALAAAQEYGARWKLGDIITMRHDDWGAEMDARITEVAISYGEDSTHMDLVFGSAAITLTGRLKQIEINSQSEAKK